VTAYLCETCGTQFPPSANPPELCPICEDDRQYVGLNGQKWTSLDLLKANYRNDFIPMETGLTAILTEPSFAIGQRAFLIESPGGNILWDCLALLDSASIAFVRERGGLTSIAISHPHYYTTMAEWAAEFDVPVYLHSADRQWVMRHDPRLHFWDGETLALHDGFTLVRGGGHFEGGTVLHWPAGAGGKGALLTGDIIQVVLDRRWVSFMYSYPNLIPLSAAKVRRIEAAVEPFTFDRIYGAFHPRQVETDGKGVVRRSVERYLWRLGE
jgi:hypothetical protein